MNAKLMAALGAALLLSTPVLAQNSPGAAPTRNTCLMVGQIWSWRAPNDRTLIVEDNWHNKFKLTLMVPCQNLTFKERVGFKAFGGTQLSCLSKGDSVFVRNPGFPQNCPIREIVPYTPQMEQMDKAAEAAKQQQSP